MGKISNYASALKAKLTDFFVIASDNNGVLETKKVTTEQIGDAVASDQVHSSLDTSDKTLIGGINEINSTKSDEHTIENVSLTCPRCPISSISNTTAYGSGKIYYYASKIAFGTTSESSAAYLACSLFENVDYAMGYLYDNDNDKYYSIGKGNTTTLWVFTSSSTRTPANTLSGKQNIYINLIGIKL